MRVRLLVATDQWFPDYRGGAARMATETATRLAELGHQVTVLAPRAGSLPRFEQRGSLRVLRAIPRNRFPRTLLDGAAVWHAARRAGGPYDVALSHHPTTTVGLRASLPALPLVHVFHASPSVEARLARKQLPLGLRRGATYPLEPTLALLERLTLRRAERVFVLSEYSGALAAQREGSGAAVRLVPAGVDTDRFSPGDGRDAARARVGIASSDLLLVAVRRLDAGLGLEQLVAAVAKLENRRVCLAVVGSGPLEPRLRAQASYLAGRVLFAGEADDTRLADWYRAADLFVLPPARHEGFGLATVEALACGTPAVGVDVGATPSVLTPLEPALVAASDDPSALARAIRAGLMLGGSDAFRRRCRDYAVERFGWGTALPVWERELEELTKSPRIDHKEPCLH
jgi:glycosyltransferase involved in cell wall biosynthesis